MRSRVPARIAAVWLALLFLLTQGADALGLHECRAHGSALATPGAHALHAGHGASESDPAHHPGGGQGGCTCVGTCHAGAPTVAPPAGALSWLPPVERVAAPATHPVSSIRPLRTPYLLPYAQAPRASADPPVVKR